MTTACSSSVAEYGTLRSVRRIAVIGCPGSGKTWLASRIARALQLPHVELDDHFWGPGWTPTQEPTWRAKVERLASEPEWVIDGNYEQTLAIRLHRCEWLIWTDLSTSQCLSGVLLRLARSCMKPASALPHYMIRTDGSVKRHNDFAMFLPFVASFRRTVRPRILRALEALTREEARPIVTVISSRREVVELMHGLTLGSGVAR